ncbi:hypothetical protein Daus18300_008174 [Diaporthe australafricana]|uniref:Fungal N-terminal domain-containing protein n=1 Tax=Diaporthe australafricana TaxID=127596 RepID=A0ABR3WJM2_9PEZI
MSDPLSITASVAGLVSLGLQVVSGITQYLDAVHERKDDVASAKTQVIRTQNPLKLVIKVAAKVEPNHSAIAAVLRDSASVKPELQALDEFVRSLDATRVPPPSHEVLGKVFVQAKKLTYPFHRPTLERLQSRLIRVNEGLQAALQVSGLDVAIDIEHTTSAIKTTLPDLTWKLSEEIKQESVASRDAVARVGDWVVSLSGRFDQGLAKVLEDIATTSTTSMSVLQEDRDKKQAMLLQEILKTCNGVASLSDSVQGVDMSLVKIQEDIASSRTATASVLHEEYAWTRSKVLEELEMTRSGVSEFGDAFKRFELALRAHPTREEFGHLISKPGELKDLCDIMEDSSRLITSQHITQRPRINLERRICVCRKRIVRSGQALLWGPWQVLKNTSTTHDHFPDCICHVQGAAVSSKRWAVAFKGLQGRINRAIEVSFSLSFGAGGCSLSPGFNYYPNIDRRRDPAFRIMGLISWARFTLVNQDLNRDFAEFVELCMDNMALLYRCGKASPKAVDQYGRGVLHYTDIREIVGLPYSITTP